MNKKRRKYSDEFKIEAGNVFFMSSTMTIIAVVIRANDLDALNHRIKGSAYV